MLLWRADTRLGCIHVHVFHAPQLPHVVGCIGISTKHVFAYACMTSAQWRWEGTSWELCTGTSRDHPSHCVGTQYISFCHTSSWFSLNCTRWSCICTCTCIYINVAMTHGHKTRMHTCTCTYTYDVCLCVHVGVSIPTLGCIHVHVRTCMMYACVYM